MESLFERLKMNDTRDILGAKMSTGMKQKVSVARAVVHDPPVLIFDEATAGLDVLVARALLQTVAELRDHGKCILFSTHIMREAERLCDRVAILHRGQVLAEGTLEELRDRHHQRDLEELFFQLISQHDDQQDDSRLRLRTEQMKLSNVKLILCREIRDQLRDRRTLFMIAVLPVLLYPLMGMSLLQISQFMQEQPTRVLVVGAKDLVGLPPLFENQQFAGRLFTDPGRTKLLELHFTPDGPPAPGETPAEARAEAYRQVQAGQYEAALYFPPDFTSRLDAFRAAIRHRAENSPLPGRGAEGKGIAWKSRVPRSSTARPTTNRRSPSPGLSEVLRRWTDEIGEDNLVQSGVPTFAVRPFLVQSADVADADHRDASLWSKILPVLMLIWALSGAFYPAVDLCAGEKERGTLETLLCSPAARSEIVVGKLADHHALQHPHRRAEPVEHRADRLDGGRAVARFRAAAADGHRRRADRLGAHLGPVQRLVPGAGGLCAEHEGRAILLDAPAVDHHAAGDSAHVARRGAEPGEQPDSHHGRGAPAAKRAGGQLLAGGPVLAARDRP